MDSISEIVLSEAPLKTLLKDFYYFCDQLAQLKETCTEHYLEK